MPKLTSQAASRKPPEKEKSTKNDPSKWCFLHESPHPLRVCRELRSKPYCEHMDLLAQHHICFRCVSSSCRTAKDCTLTCLCDRHVTALHIDEPKQGNQVFNRAERKHGEEARRGSTARSRRQSTARSRRQGILKERRRQGILKERSRRR